MIMLRRILHRLFVVFLLRYSALLAQTTNGAIVGSVTDSSDAAISGAAVTITNLGTNQKRSASTGSDGSYRVLNLPVGDYEVAIETQGFKRFVERPVTLASRWQPHSRQLE